MKNLQIHILAILFTIGLSYAAPANAMFQDDREPYTTKQFTVSTPGEVQVNTSGGSISVHGHNSNEVVVKMYVKKSGPSSWFSDDDDLEEALEDYDISIRQEGNTIFAQSEKKGSGWNSNSLSISFVLEVPREMSAKLNTSGGSISMEHLEGEHDVRTSGGSLNFEDITGFTKAHTSGGSINVTNYQGVLNGKTSGGSIRTQQAGGELSLHTSGGSIILEDVSGSIDARTSGGSIKAFILDLDEYLTLRTSGGSVNAVIPEGMGVDLDLSGNRVNTKLTNFTGESEKNHIEGSMNGGGIPVTLKTSGGSVNLDYHRTEAKN
jgi:hypothetical protein